MCGSCRPVGVAGAGLEVTDAVHDEIREWQARPWSTSTRSCPSTRYGRRSATGTRRCISAIGVTCMGRKEVPRPVDLIRHSAGIRGMEGAKAAGIDAEGGLPRADGGRGRWTPSRRIPRGGSNPGRALVAFGMEPRVPFSAFSARFRRAIYTTHRDREVRTARCSGRSGRQGASRTTARTKPIHLALHGVESK